MRPPADRCSPHRFPLRLYMSSALVENVLCCKVQAPSCSLYIRCASDKYESLLLCKNGVCTICYPVICQNGAESNKRARRCRRLNVIYGRKWKSAVFLVCVRSSYVWSIANVIVLAIYSALAPENRWHTSDRPRGDIVVSSPAIVFYVVRVSLGAASLP